MRTPTSASNQDLNGCIFHTAVHHEFQYLAACNRVKFRYHATNAVPTFAPFLVRVGCAMQTLIYTRPHLAFITLHLQQLRHLWHWSRSLQYMCQTRGRIPRSHGLGQEYKEEANCWSISIILSPFIRVFSSHGLLPPSRFRLSRSSCCLLRRFCRYDRGEERDSCRQSQRQLRISQPSGIVPRLMCLDCLAGKYRQYSAPSVLCSYSYVGNISFGRAVTPR
jgi:hypothetical protein